MKIEPKVYTKRIEKKLIENIFHAQKSIRIAVAWFTSQVLKDCLIEKKRKDPSVSIEIVVDNNSTNEKYFLNSKPQFDEVEIKIKDKTTNRFLHHKFMVIDDEISITGSYNYSKKARYNLENIVITKSQYISSYFIRVFNFLTEPHCIDQNIKLLFRYPKFAQSIVSTYYEFSYKEYFKFRDKLILGDCFTHENGMFDEIKYYPGFIFNPKVKFAKKIQSYEFELPIEKGVIKAWIKGRNMDFILESFREFRDQYHLINNELEEEEKNTDHYFKRTMEKVYNSEELERLIQNGIDIIIEDDLWLNNFEPFINKEIVQNIFESIEINKKEENWW